VVVLFLCGPWLPMWVLILREPHATRGHRMEYFQMDAIIIIEVNLNTWPN
jgi:hypothetical protein